MSASLAGARDGAEVLALSGSERHWTVPRQYLPSLYAQRLTALAPQ